MIERSLFNHYKLTLESQIKAVLARDGKDGSESTVVALHCAQMKEWGIRGGNIEFRPIQDDKRDTRLKFITKIWEANDMKQRLDYISDVFTCRGEILWLFLPHPEKRGEYQIEFFTGGLNNPDPQYKVFYKPGGREIDRALITYSYNQELPGGFGGQKIWVKIVVTPERIYQSESLNKPLLGRAEAYQTIPYNYGAFLETNQATNSYENPFAPYLPIKISKNNPRQLGQQGVDDFYQIKELIEKQEELVMKAHKNLRMFSNPIFVTTRSANEVLSQEAAPNTWAAANRYVDMSGDMFSGSTHPSDSPAWGMQRTPFGLTSTSTTEGSLDTVIGNVGERERFGFIQADAVSGDQNLWIRQQRELIHWILGGIDPLAGISAGATFGEIKTLFGRVQNTADKKSQGLFGTHGIAGIFELILYREEQIFKNWLFATLVTFYSKEFGGLTSPAQLSDEICQQLWSLKESGEFSMPGEHQGLVPLGDREVIWRYTREVFQNTTREALDRSIEARNQREDGLSQEWVLRNQYPNMTDQEIRNAMSGFSPRVVQNAAIGINTMMQLFQQFMTIPDPENPKAPWGMRLGVPQLLEQAMHTLQKEISYGTPVYEPAEEPAKPTSLAEVLLNFNPVLNQGINTNVPILPTGNFPASNGGELPYSSPLPSMGLPTTWGGFSRSAQQSGQFGGFAQGARGAIPNPGATVSQPNRATGDGISGAIPNPYNRPNSRPATAIGTAGELDPSLWSLYEPQLRAILTALKQSRS